MSKDEYLQKLGRHIVDLRTERGITQAELARRCFKDKYSIMRVEMGRVNPTAYYLLELSTGLGVSVSELFAFLDKK